MNYFLMLVILLLGCGGFYEYNILHSQHDGDVQRLTDATTERDTLKEQSAKLTADNAQLTKSNAEAQTELADLAKQLQDAQATLLAEKQKEEDAKAKAVTVVPNPLPMTGTNDLGTIATLDGKVYPASQLMKVQAESIVVSYAGGITQIPFSLMQPELQKRFGFDPKVALALTADQVAVAEQKRKAAGSTAGN